MDFEVVVVSMFTVNVSVIVFRLTDRGVNGVLPA